MSTETTKRQPAGIPVGGQFASHDRADAEVSLAATPGAEANKDWIRQSNAAYQDGLLRDQLMVRAFERTIADHLPVGTKVVFTRDWDSDGYMFDRIERDGIALDRNPELEEALAPMLRDADQAPDEFFDDEESFQAEYRSLTVKAPGAPDRLDATAAIRRASEEAGLGGIMPAVFDVLLDRADGDETILARYAEITSAEITHLYEIVLAQSITDVDYELADMDEREQRVSRPEPTSRETLRGNAGDR